MPITNLDKPGAVGMTNTFKNYQTRWDTWTTAWDNNNVRNWDDLAGQIHTNVAKVSVGETWATIETTWATETRTWLAASQLFTNVKIETDYLWSNKTFPWELTSPWTQA